MAIDTDAGAEPVHFLHMHEAVFKDRFRHAAAAFGDTVDGHELRLHIGGKARVFRGAKTHCFRPRCHLRADPVRARRQDHANFTQLVERDIKDVGTRMRERHVTARGGDRAQEGRGFNAVSNNLVRCAMQALNAGDDEAIGADAIDFCAHGHEQVRQVRDFRLARGIVKNGFAFRQRGCHQQVFRAGDGDHVGDDARALELSGFRMDVAGFDRDLRAHRLQTLDVLVDGPRTDRTAARQRHLRLAKARQ